MSLRASKTHGLNPTIPICMFCGKDRNEIALLGTLPKDQAAPMHCIIDQEPCDECKNNMSMGVTLFAVSETPKFENMQPVRGGLYLTGAYAVVTPESVARMFNKPGKAGPSFTGDRILIDEAIMHEILKQTKGED